MILEHLTMDMFLSFPVKLIHNICNLFFVFFFCSRFIKVLVFSGPTASLTQTLSLLREVLASHDLSVLPLDARQADFAQMTFLFMFCGKILFGMWLKFIKYQEEILTVFVLFLLYLLFYIYLFYIC